MCTSVAAGKKATKSSNTLIARNEDCERNNWNKYMVYRKNPEYYPIKNNIVIQKNKWVLGNGLEVDIPKKHYSYSAMPDAIAYEEATHSIKSRYFFEERGINECNVAISATNSLSARASQEEKNSDGTINNRYDKNCKKMQELDPFVKIGIEESIITTLILPQMESAKNGVELLGKYVETKGASEGNGILFSDKDEVWYMEIGSGHHWIAIRVPDNMYITIANGMRIHNVDLDSSDVLHSKKLFEFVSKNKFLQNPKKNSFNFAQAFGILGDPYNDDRIWLAQRILTPSKKQNPPKIQDRQKVKGAQTKEQYPLFLKPDKKIKLRDVMNLLRANYNNTPLQGKAKRPIGVYRTGESHIITIDSSMPKSVGGIIWQALSTPLGTPYIPLYNAMDEVPANYAIGNDQYNPLSAFWSFRGLFGMAECNKSYEKQIQEYWFDYEDQFLNEISFVNSSINNMFKKDKSIANDFAKRYSVGISYDAVAKANKKRDSLMTKLTLEQGYQKQNL